MVVMLVFIKLLHLLLLLYLVLLLSESSCSLVVARVCARMGCNEGRLEAGKLEGAP